MSRNSSLSDNQRRLACRLTFVLLGVIPTLVSGYAIMHQPGTNDWQNLIEAKLGIRVQIDSVETPRPFESVLRGVRIESIAGLNSDDLPDVRVLNLAEVHIARHAHENRISFVQPIPIQTRALTNILRSCSLHLDSFVLDDKPWKIDFKKIVLVDDEPATADFVLRPATLTLQRQQDSIRQPGSSSIQATFLAQVPHQDSVHQLEIEFEKTGNQRFIDIDTWGGTLPSHLVRHAYPNVQHLGHQCGFRGTMNLRFDAGDELFGLVAGRLEQIQLDQLAQTFGHSIRGSCNMTQLALEVDRDRIKTAQFQLDTNGAGTVERRFLQDLAWLKIRTWSRAEQEMVTFSHVSFALKLKEGRLSIGGQEVEDQGEVVGYAMATDAQGELLALSPFDLVIPAQNLAMVITGERTLSGRSIALLDHFQVPGDEFQMPHQAGERTAAANAPSHY